MFLVVLGGVAQEERKVQLSSTPASCTYLVRKFNALIFVTRHLSCVECDRDYLSKNKEILPIIYFLACAYVVISFTRRGS